MQKLLLNGLLPALLLIATSSNAGLVPYQAPTEGQLLVKKFDLNKDSFVSEGEVQEGLREAAVDKSIRLQKQGIPQSATSDIIKEMEKNVNADAEKIVQKLDKDGDKLVEPEDVKRR